MLTLSSQRAEDAVAREELRHQSIEPTHVWRSAENPGERTVSKADLEPKEQ